MSISWSDTGFDGLSNEGNALLLIGQGSVFVMRGESCVEVPGAGPRLHAGLSFDGKYLGFVRSRNVFLTDVASGREIAVSDAAGTVMAGEGDFIHQEEFYTFRTWSLAPGVSRLGEHRVLYLEMDEAGVHVFNLATLDDMRGTVDPFRYALTGTKNSTVRVRLASIAADGQSVSRATLDVLPPWTEYVPRQGWLDATHAWLVVTDRLQQRAALLSVDVESLTVSTLLEERSESFVGVSHMVVTPLHVFRDGSLLVASERSGFRHLYRLARGALTPITSGVGWEVIVSAPHSESLCHVWVDPDEQRVFFSATRDSALQTHLYAASLAAGGEPPVRLTEAGWHHECVVDPASGFAVDVCSNLSAPHEVRVLRLHATGSSQPLLLHPAVGPRDPFPGVAPRPFTLQSNGFDLHGLTYLPPNYDSSRRYPLVVYVYGGPGVQIVNHSYNLTRSMRSARLQLLAHLGFVVSVMDNRGSLGRGKAFEAELQRRMGTVEVEDQVKHVELLVREGIADPKRVAVFGSSYGGYMSLLLLCRRPDVFKIAYSFAPVTQWEAYDTGYTERYMGLPAENVEGYANGSVLHHAQGFPDEPDRLVLFHGGSDENVHFCHTAALCKRLNDLKKPYQLCVYPADRHGIGGRHAPVTQIHHVLRHL